MPNQINLMLVMSLTASFVFFASGVVHYITTRRNSTKVLYFIVMLLMAGWTLTLALMNTTNAPQAALFWRNVGAFFWVLSYPTIINFYYVTLQESIHLKTNRLYQLLLYVPAIIVFYALYFVFPYSANDLFLTQLGWVYINQGPSYNFDHYLYLYIGIYGILFFILTHTLYKLSIFKRQRVLVVQLLISTIVACLVGGFTDVISAEINGLYLLPIGGIVVLYIPFILYHAFKTHTLSDLESPQLLKESTQYIHDAIILTRPDHRIGYTNKTLKLYLSIDHFDDLKKYKFPEDVTKIATKADKLTIDFEHQSIEKIIDGKIYYYEYKVNEIKDAYGDTVSLSYIIRDISELKRTQNDLLRSKNRLEEMVDLRTKELKKTTVALKNYNIDLKNEIEQRQAIEARVNFLAYHDSLTECYNRDRFIMLLNNFLKTTDETYVYAHIDIRNFRIINDNFGHDIGDIYIKTVACLLRDHTPHNTIICRLGGDEFGLFFKDYHTTKDAKKALTQLFATLTEQIIKHNLNMPLSFTGGIALYPQHANDVNDLLYKSELAMIEAKALGENNYIVYKPLFKENIKKQLDMVEAISDALNNDHFKIYYQPQVKHINDKITIIGVEALIRWIDPIKGFISPSEFIPVAEKSNQIIQIGQFVVKKALSDIGMLKKKFGKSLTLAINVSANQFNDEKLVDIIKSYAKKNDIRHDKIEIELTERLLVNASTFSGSILTSIKDLGVKVAIDDFGVEYSSLNYLKKLPIDKIKIDMSFVHGIGKNPKDEVILETMINLSERLNLDVLSEGIEIEDQFQFLARSSSKMEYQGYYFHKPMPIEDLTEVHVLDKMQNI